ncbi:MAG: hypothetical protein ACKOPG_13515 [Novosphingobium sp.]
MTQTGTRFRFQAALLVAAAFALRMDSFGDPVAHSVDQFYLLVGQRMHWGLVPYVDIWDRKPPGIFLIYYLLTFVSTSAVVFQVAATLFAAATAVMVARISSRWASPTGAVFAGLLYLLMLGDFYGNTGEAAIFYNLFVAVAVYLITGVPDFRRFCWAMLCLGVALTIKQTVIFEACLLGCAAVMRLSPDRWWRNGLEFVAIGILPTALFAGWFLLIGHFPAFWNAVTASIFLKASPTSADIVGRSLDLGRRFIPLVALCAIALVLPSRPFAPHRGFVMAWIAAAVLGVILVPQLYIHYGQPLVLPLSVAASCALDRGRVGMALGALAALASLIYHAPFQFAAHARSKAEMVALSELVRSLPGDSLLVFDGPSALYTMSGRRFLSPLVFPPHLNHAIELNVSGIDTNREIVRVLAMNPEVVVMATTPRNQPANAVGWRLVRGFTAERCRLVAAPVVHEMGTEQLQVYACANAQAN